MVRSLFCRAKGQGPHTAWKGDRQEGKDRREREDQPGIRSRETGQGLLVSKWVSVIPSGMREVPKNTHLQGVAR
jgi:hypothetical protein